MYDVLYLNEKKELKKKFKTASTILKYSKEFLFCDANYIVLKYILKMNLKMKSFL